MADFVEQVEPVDSLFNRLSDSEEAVVPEERSFLRAQGISNITTFIFGKDDSFAIENDVILVTVHQQKFNWMHGYFTYIVEDT